MARARCALVLQADLRNVSGREDPEPGPRHKVYILRVFDALKFSFLLIIIFSIIQHLRSQAIFFPLSFLIISSSAGQIYNLIFKMLFKTFLVTIAASQLVAGHGAIIKATGDAGGSGQALGGKLHVSIQRIVVDKM